MYDIEILKGKNIEDLFYEYRDLSKKTVHKYYSKYMSTMWQEDVYNVAEIGVYKGLQKIKLEKVKNETSIKAAIVWSIRMNIKNFEREMFGYENTEKRAGSYKTYSYNKKSKEDGKEFEETLSDLNLLCNNELSENQRIEYMDLYKALNKLNNDERYFIKRTMDNATLSVISDEMRISKDKAFRLKKKIFSKLKKELEVIMWKG